MKQLIFAFVFLSLSLRPAYAAKPTLEPVLASSVILAGKSLSVGKAYILAKGPYLQVNQNTVNGLLIHINGYNSGPNLFMLKTSTKRVDDSLLPVPVCGVYDGTTQYRSLLGIRTVHQLKEVECAHYNLPEGASVKGYSADGYGISEWNRDTAVATVRGHAPRDPRPENPTPWKEKPAQKKETDSLTKSEQAYHASTFPKGIKAIIKAVIADIHQCQQTNHCQLESAVYAIESAENGQYAAYLTTPKNTMELHMAHDYLGYKAGKNVFLTEYWPTLEKLVQDNPDPTIEEIYQSLFTPRQLDPQRWVHAFTYRGNAVLVDTQTVQKKPLMVAGSGPPVEYTAWVTSANMFGHHSEPSQVRVNCADQANIKPGSSDEQLTRWFCTSPDAMNTVSLRDQQQQAANQQLQRSQAAQQQWANQQRSRQTIQQGVQFLQRFLPLF